MNEDIEQLLVEAHATQERLKALFKRKAEVNKVREFRKKMKMGLLRQAPRLVQEKEQGEILPMNDETLRQLEEKHPLGAQAEEETLLHRKEV